MNWAEQAENEKIKKNWGEPSDDEESLPPPEVIVEGDIKTVLEYKYNEKNQKVKVHNDIIIITICKLTNVRPIN